MADIIIDVSSYNGVVDWESLKKKGVKGGIAKIIRKDLNKDNQFDNNYNALHALKMPWGVYNYSYATTVSKARSDMNLVCDMLDRCDKTYFKYGVWFDIEDKVQAVLGKATIADIINAAQDTVESRGYVFGTYTGMSYYKEHIYGSGVKCRNWWIARYYLGYTAMQLYQEPNANYKPQLPTNICAWQYSSSVEIPATGNGGRGDASVLYTLPTKVGSTKSQTTTEQSTRKNEKVIIGSARIDENGNISHGKAGDQTGREVATEDFYQHSKGWIVLRAKSSTVAKKLAKAMKAACANDNIGYSQSDRNSLYNVASKVSFNLSKVTTKCNCDCSSLVRVCLAYAGIKVGDFNTASERSVIEATGKFDVITSVSKDMLKAGDILNTKTQGHTAIVVSVDGNTQESSSTSTKTGTHYNGTYPALPPRGFYQKGDGITSLKDYPTQIKRVQMLMNWLNGSNIAVDGQYGKQTEDAVNKFKKKVGLKQDGCFNLSTLNAAKEYTK